MLQGEVVAGAVDITPSGAAPLTVSVIATPAGTRAEAYLAGPRLPPDGHNRHGLFDIASFGALSARFTVGGPDGSVRFGERSVSPKNVDANDAGRDTGNYGVVHRLSFALDNPTDETATVYLYHKPLGGPARGAYLVDGRLRELGCARLPQPYWIATYALPPHATGASTVLTMPDGGSYYPVEFGVTTTRPEPYTPPAGSPDGCSAVRTAASS